jgi:hypothetical protein
VTWSDEATEIVEELLRELPLPTRESVQQATRFRAEAAVEEAGRGQVALEDAVRAFIEATPADLRERLKHTLSYRGVDPEDFAAAFAS